MNTRSVALLYLHGVTSADGDDSWRDALEGALLAQGFPGLADVTVVAPRYRQGLLGVSDEWDLPPVSISSLVWKARAPERRAFERRQMAMERLLGNERRGAVNPVGDTLIPLALDNQRFAQAKNYLQHSSIRAYVLRQIIDQLGGVAGLVIVGHSLGSVIAADLLLRLPPSVEVVGLVTIGSPLGFDVFQVDRLRDLLRDPAENLGWWVNFWNPADPVTLYRGVSAAIPWVLDQRVSDGGTRSAHDAASYLGSGPVAKAVGIALFGSQSTGLALAGSDAHFAWDDIELAVLLALRLGHLTLASLTGETKDRFREALRAVQANAVDRMRDRMNAEGRVPPAALLTLAVELGDPDSSPRSPQVPSDLGKDQLIDLLVAVATANVVYPYEIEVPDEVHESAIEQLAMELEMGSRLGQQAVEAVGEARDAVKSRRSWQQLTAIAVGAAAIVAASGGLALAAAPGVAGAAAVTSALASFGPGGMIGGLITAGSLVTAGGGSIVVGLAAPASSAVAVEAVLVNRLAVAILRKKSGLPVDTDFWAWLAAVAAEIDDSLRRVEGVSDASSASVKELKRKQSTVRRVQAYLEGAGIGPDPVELMAASDEF